MIKSAHIIEVPRKELIRYWNHGIAKIDTLNLIKKGKLCERHYLEGSFRIDLEELRNIEDPNFIYVRMAPIAPKFMFYGQRIIPPSNAKPVPLGISELEVRVIFNSMLTGYSSVILPQIGLKKHRN